MKSIITSLILSGIGITSLGIIPANAETATIEADNDIYISGLGSYQKIEVTYEGVPKTSKKTSNECGYIRLASSSSTPINTASDSITFEGTTYALSSVPSSGALKCTNGILEGTIAGPVQTDAEGRVYLTGLSSFTDYYVAFDDIFTSRKIKANTCGIAKVGHSLKYDNTAGTMTVTDADTAAALGALPANIPSGDGPLCRRGVGFYPTSYPATENF